MATILPYLYIATVVWTCALSHQSTGRISQSLPVPASCMWDEANNVLQCSYLRAQSMTLLEEALQNTSQLVTSFSVDISNSQGPDIPTDVFLGYNLTGVWLFQNNFTAIPYELLSSIDSPMLDTLSVAAEFLSSDNHTSTDMLLPYSEFLQSLYYAELGLETIDQPTFTQYSNLQHLELYSNVITSVGLEYLGLTTLVELNLEQNKIETIETGAFRDLGNLQYLYLDRNKLSTLQEDAFTGLETSPLAMVGLDGNPWNCSCELQWLKDWLNDQNLVESSGAYCIYPIQSYFNDFDFCNFTLTDDECDEAECF